MQLAPPTTSSIGKTLYFLVFYVSATAAVRLGNMTRGKEIFSLRDFGNFDAIKARTQRRPFLIITENKTKNNTTYIMSLFKKNHILNETKINYGHYQIIG